MSVKLSPQEILHNLDSEAQKLEELCTEFQPLLTDDQWEECLSIDLGGMTEDLEGSEGGSSDEEFLAAENLDGRISGYTLTSSSSSSSSSSTSTVRSCPSQLSSKTSQESDYGSTPSALTAISLAKVLLTGTIPRLKEILKKLIENPSDSVINYEEICDKYDTFQTVKTEAIRRFDVLRQRQSQNNENENPISLSNQRS